mmetsp:Transcript_15731/g.40726  ORF Transcript_15731/g.40726 Transcript_15731/m.40726 type:complete len:220 (+) Transcript_15731:88-747(+)
MGQHFGINPPDQLNLTPSMSLSPWVLMSRARPGPSSASRGSTEQLSSGPKESTFNKQTFQRMGDGPDSRAWSEVRSHASLVAPRPHHRCSAAAHCCHWLCAEMRAFAIFVVRKRSLSPAPSGCARGRRADDEAVAGLAASIWGRSGVSNGAAERASPCVGRHMPLPLPLAVEGLSAIRAPAADGSAGMARARDLGCEGGSSLGARSPVSLKVAAAEEPE